MTKHVGKGDTTRVISRRAVLVGCTYPGTKQRLHGPINDVKCLYDMLTQKLGFRASDIRVLHDASDDDIIPSHATATRKNIVQAIAWLVRGDASTLFFSFSGHGDRRLDLSADEIDGYDEILLPTDHATQGGISDDELYDILACRVPKGASLHALIDACHSGTILDLPVRVVSPQNLAWRSVTRGASYPSPGARVVQISASEDHQVARDGISANIRIGAATYCFTQAILTHGTTQTYAQLIKHMATALRAATGRAGPNLSLGGWGDTFMSVVGGTKWALLLKVARLLLPSGQSPVLSSNRVFDLSTTIDQMFCI